MAPKLDPSCVEWQRQLLRALKIGGFWAVPRSRLIVTKTSENSVELTTSGPADPGEQCVVDHIRAAGYTVRFTGGRPQGDPNNS